MTFRVPLIVIGVLLTVRATSQTTYYVSTNGSGSNSGLSASVPWDLATGLAALTNNNLIVMLDGNFWTGPQTAPSGMGPGTLMAQHKWTAGIVNGSTWNLGFASPAAASGLTINGLVLTNAQSNDNLSGNGLRNSTIENCWIAHAFQQGINFANGNCSNNIIDSCLVEFNGQASNSDYHGIYFAGPNNILRNSVIRGNCLGFGCQMYSSVLGQQSYNSYVYNNAFYGHTNAAGLTLWSAGVSGTGYTNSYTNYVFCNTILDGCWTSYGIVDVSNNIILPALTELSDPLHNSVSHPATLNADYNLGTNTISGGGTHNILTNFNGLGFVNYASGLYWLTAASAARASAVVSCCSPADFFGQSQRYVSDVGAFQYNTVLGGDNRTLFPSPATGADYWQFPISYAFSGSLSNSFGLASLTPFPTSNLNWTNPISSSIMIFIDSAGVSTTGFKVNGTTIYSTLANDIAIGLQPGEYFSMSYSGGTPVGHWKPFP